MEINFNEIREYLRNLCLNNLIDAIINDKPLIINNNELITVYTYVYDKCIKDKNRIYCDFFYQYYKNLIQEFIIILLNQNKDKDIIEKILKDYKKYNFYIKNLSIMFRILNKHYLIKNNYEDLEELSVYYFKCEYLSKNHIHIINWIQNELFKNKENPNDNENFSQLIDLYTRVNCVLIDNLIEHYFCMIKNYYELILDKNLKLNEMIDLFYKYYFQELKLLEKINYKHKEKEIKQIILKGFNETRFLTLCKEMVINFLYKKNTFHYINDLFNIHSENIYILFENELNVICNDTNYFENIYHVIENIESIIKSEHIRNILSNLVKKNFNQQLSKNYQLYGNLVQLLYKNINYLPIIHIIENMDPFINFLCDYFYKNCNKINYQYEKDIELFQKIKFLKVNKYLYKLDLIINDITQSEKFNKKLNSNYSIFLFSKMNDFIGLKNIKLPNEILEFELQLKESYKQLYENRKLEFDYFKSTIQIEMVYKNNRVHFYLSFIQYIILKCIIHNYSMTIIQLMTNLNISYEMIAPILHSLTIVNQNLIKKSGISNSIDKNNDLFSFNSNYKIPNQIVFKLPMIHQKNISSNEKLNDKEYKFLIQSKIMKMIKTKQSVSIKDLNDILSIYDSKLIKENIDYLIDMEYIDYKDHLYHFI